ncbi:MAG: SPOR domain-containing protein [Paramuribaculum sp.]|nr:SPOR domain-containing protein [Paramuribaculum sp.]
MNRYLLLTVSIVLTVCFGMSVSNATTSEQDPNIVTHFADSGKNIIVAPAGVLEMLEYNEQVAPVQRRVSRVVYRAQVFREQSRTGVKDKAERLAANIRRRFPKYAGSTNVTINSGNIIRVHVGFFETEAQAKAVAEEICRAFGSATSFASAYRETRTVLE